MKINTFNGRRLSVVFSYHAEGSGKPRTTACSIRDEAGKVLANSVALCSRRDQFRKAEGRKVALARALFYLFPRDDDACFRAEIWFGYHSRPGSKVDAVQAALKFAHRAIHQGKLLGFMAMGSESPKLLKLRVRAS